MIFLVRREAKQIFGENFGNRSEAKRIICFLGPNTSYYELFGPKQDLTKNNLVALINEDRILRIRLANTSYTISEYFGNSIQ